ncbi:MAG: DUF4382 domain-containing protein [Nitrospira sp.]|nr:DUF4382 domain-containing protein [Nitrospira sp.]
MVSKSLPRFTRWLGLLLLIAVVAGCGSDGGGGGTAVARPGTVSVSLTDAPACGYEAVVVTVREVRIHQSSSVDDLNGAGWRTIVLDTPRSINLLDLNDPTQPNFALHYLGETPLPAGHYTQLRLVLEENRNNQPPVNWIVLEGQDPNNPNDRIPLETPSALRSGIKLIHQFTVNSGQRVDLLLDFDACHSIVQTGNGTYKLKPVIKVIPYELNGIEGFVDTALLNSNVVVSAQRNGEIVRATVPNTSPDPALQGKFFLARLPGQPGSTDYPANYDVVITANGHATAVIAAVPVQAAPQITPISTIIGLNGSSSRSISGTATLNPATDEASVFVAARQTLNSGPPVTVKSVVGTVLDNAAPSGDYSYNLTLPIASPALYQYNATTHVIAPDLGSQASVAGQYTVRGSAQTETTVYTVQTPPTLSVNIAILDQPNQNFVLAPPPTP